MAAGEGGVNTVYWREPLWLLAALYPLLLWAWARWRQRHVRSGFVDAALWPWVRADQVRAGQGWTKGGRLQRLILAGSWILLAVALAGPRQALEVPEQARPPSGALLAVLDLSRSMETRDIAGSRRAAARRLLQAWNAEPDRPPLGVVVFSGRAHLFFPPSPDRPAVAHFLEQLPGLTLPTLGNDLAGGLALTADVLWDIEGHPAIVLLSDGDLDEAARERAEAAVERLQSTRDLSFTVIGVGSTTATAVPDPETGWLAVDGRPVVSRLETVWLQRLAQAGGGQYRSASAEGAIGVGELWRAPAPRIAADDREQVLWRELYPWALAPALLLLGLALSGRVASGVAVAGLGVVAAGLLPAPSQAVDLDIAFSALTQERYQEARSLYGQIPGYAGRYGEGVACFRLEEWSCAAEAFAAAAWMAGDDAERARAGYNLATTQYRQGEYAVAAVLYRDARAHGLEHPQLEPTIEFVQSLAAQVEQRRREQAARRQRAGSGSRTLDADMVDAVAADRRLDAEPRNPVPLPQGLDRGLFEDLIARGLDRARLAEAGGGAAGRSGRVWFGGEDVAAERLGTQLWQRLFEIEEGFPAPVTTPRPRPKERPW